MPSELFVSYQQLYERECVRTRLLEAECQLLQRKVEHLEQSLRRLKRASIAQQSTMKQNQAKVANSPIKPRSHVTKFAQIVNGAVSSSKKCRKVVIRMEEHHQQQQKSLLQLGRAYRPSDSCSWEFEFSQLPEDYIGFNIDYIKQLTSLNSSSQQGPYLLELQCFHPLKKCYLSLFPQESPNGRSIDCFLSNFQPNLKHFQRLQKPNFGIAQPLEHTHQSKQQFLRSLYVHFQTHLPFSIQNLILEVLAERSVVVRGNDHSQIAMLIYLIRNGVDVEIPHILNYNLTDEVLLEVPAPFIYGLVASQSEPEVEPSGHVMLVDLEAFSIAPRLSAGQCSNLLEILEAVGAILPYRSMPPETLDTSLSRLELTPGTIGYLKRFIRTTTFRNLTSKPAVLLTFLGFSE